MVNRKIQIKNNAEDNLFSATFSGNAVTPTGTVEDVQ